MELLALEIIYDEKQQSKIIGFKKLDPISLRPFVEETPDGWKRKWIQYEYHPKLKRTLFDSQVIFLSYTKESGFSRISYVEILV